MRLKVKISTGKSKFYIKQKDDILLVGVKSNPIDGKANLEIIKELKKIFKREVRIVFGHKSKNKIIEIDFLEKNEINNILNKQI